MLYFITCLFSCSVLNAVCFVFLLDFAFALKISSILVGFVFRPDEFIKIRRLWNFIAPNTPGKQAVQTYDAAASVSYAHY